MKFLNSLFKKKEIIEIEHEKFGLMQFDENSNFWETTEREIFHSVPGLSEAPNK